MDMLSLISKSLSIAAAIAGLVLLISATRWLISHVDALVSYRAQWLITLETWFVRIFWLAVFAAYITAFIHVSDTELRLGLIFIPPVLFVVLVFMWGFRYWQDRLKIEATYDRMRERSAIGATVITSLFVVGVFFVIVRVPPLFLAAIGLVCYGAFQYHRNKWKNRRNARLAEAIAKHLQMKLGNVGGMWSYLHEFVRVSTPTVRVRLELEDERTLWRIEQWLLEDVRVAMGVDRVVLREVADKCDYEEPEERTIVDVWVYNKNTRPPM